MRMKQLLSSFIALIFIFSLCSCNIKAPQIQDTAGTESEMETISETETIYSETSISTQPQETEEIKKEPLVIEMGAPVNKLSGFSASVFSSYLNDEGFTDAVDQSTLEKKLATYKHQGKKITDCVNVMFGCGERLICRAGERGLYRFGYLVELYTDYDARRSTVDNSFFTMIPLDNFDLPCNVDFEDTLTEVLLKTGIGFDYVNDFVADEGSEIEMTLYRDERNTLTMVNEGGYSLIYAETYFEERDNGEEQIITRKITFFFDEETEVLSKFSIYTFKKY